MDKPPPYNNHDDDDSWPNDKGSRGLKGVQSHARRDSRGESSSRRGRLLLEDAQRRDHADEMALVPAGNRIIELPDDFNSNSPVPTPGVRSSTGYFRPQATLDHPLDIDLDTYRQRGIQDQGRNVPNTQNQALAPSVQSALALIKPGMSKDEQVDIVLSNNPDIDFDELLKLLERLDTQGHNVEPVRAITQDSARQMNRADQVAIRRTTALPTGERQISTARQTTSNNNRGMTPKSPQQLANSTQGARAFEQAQQTQPSLQSRSQKSAAELEEEDFQLALQLSQEMSHSDLSQARSSTSSRTGRNTAASSAHTIGNITQYPSGDTAIRMRRVADHATTPAPVTSIFPPEQRADSFRDSTSSLNISSLSIPSINTALPSNTQDIVPVQPLPLFPGGVTEGHLSRFPIAPNPISNITAEQQALSDTVAMHNLHAQRQADRILAERTFMQQSRSRPQIDRATQAAIALARESLADSRVQTSLTSREALQRNIEATRLQTARDELAQIQRREEMELQKQQRLHEDALRSQEAAERRRALDRKREAERDLLREQEEADARFAMELDRMQHEQTLEKVEAFSRAIDQPARRAPIPRPRGQYLSVSGLTNSEGSTRELNFGSGQAANLYDDSGSDYDEPPRHRLRGRY